MGIWSRLGYHVSYNALSALDTSLKLTIPDDIEERSDFERKTRGVIALAVVWQVLAPVKILSPLGIIESLAMNDEEHEKRMSSLEDSRFFQK